MSWLQHPRYTRVRDDLVGYLHADTYRFPPLEPVVFLCGGAESSRRDTLRDYLQKNLLNLKLFYAERVWEQIAASNGSQSALQMESELASLADLVIIIVESPGTFAELGAFSLSDPLRKKILPIVDSLYREACSFIATGPLRWIDTESNFAPTIYVPLPRILEAVDQVEERIARIPKSDSVKISDLASSPKHLLFFLCDLIAVIHPASVDVIQHYVKKIVPSIVETNTDIPTLIGLGVAMGLLRCKTISTQGEMHVFFLPASPKALERPFHHRRKLNLPSQRAAHVSVLLSIPEAKAVLQELRK